VRRGFGGVRGKGVNLKMMINRGMAYAGKEIRHGSDDSRIKVSTVVNSEYES
jgi:hypothetical protein